MTMQEIGLKPMFRDGDETGTGWSERIPWTDDECILIALDNCRNMCGLDKRQVERLIKERMALPKVFPNRLIKVE